MKNIEDLIWETISDPGFLCMVCNDGTATKKGRVQSGPIVVELLCCAGCSELSDDEVLNLLRGKKEN